MRSKKVMKKGFPKGPQMDPKSCQKSITACSGGVSKGDLKQGPSPGAGEVRSGCYLVHFSKVGAAFWVPFWDNLGDKIVEIGFQIGGKQSSENIHPNLVILGSMFGDNF